MKKTFCYWVLIILGFVYSIGFMIFAGYLSCSNQPSCTQRVFHEESIGLLNQDQLINHYKAYGCTFVVEKIKEPILIEQIKEDEVAEIETPLWKQLLIKLAKKDFCGSFYEEEWKIEADSLKISHEKINAKKINVQAVINERVLHILTIIIMLSVSWIIIIVSVILIILLTLKSRVEKMEGIELEALRDESEKKE